MANIATVTALTKATPVQAAPGAPGGIDAVFAALLQQAGDPLALPANDMAAGMPAKLQPSLLKSLKQSAAQPASSAQPLPPVTKNAPTPPSQPIATDVPPGSSPAARPVPANAVAGADPISRVSMPSGESVQLAAADGETPAASASSSATRDANPSAPAPATAGTPPAKTAADGVPADVSPKTDPASSRAANTTPAAPVAIAAAPVAQPAELQSPWAVKVPAPEKTVKAKSSPTTAGSPADPAKKDVQSDTKPKSGDAQAAIAVALAPLQNPASPSPQPAASAVPAASAPQPAPSAQPLGAPAAIGTPLAAQSGKSAAVDKSVRADKPAQPEKTASAAKADAARPAAPPPAQAAVKNDAAPAVPTHDTATQTAQSSAQGSSPVAAAQLPASAPAHGAHLTGNVQVAAQHDNATPPTSPDMLGVAIAAKSVQNVRHFDIRLDPPELGKVQVHLSVDNSGQAQATLVVDRQQTLELLQRDAPNLSRTLSDAGLMLSNNGLNFSLRGQDRQGERGGLDQGRSRALSVKAVIGADAISTPGSSASFAPHSVRLDIRV